MPAKQTDEPNASDESAGNPPTRGWAPPPPGAAWTEPSAPLPPLRLHHFFSLTAVTAVLLAMMGPRYANPQWQMPFPGGPQFVFLGVGILNAIFGAIATTFLIYGFAWRRRGIRFFHQPGHWLIVDISVAAVLSAVVQLGSRLIFLPLEEQHVALPSAAYIVFSLFSLIGLFGRVGLDVYIGIKQCYEPRWKWVFFARAIAGIVQFLGDLVVVLLLFRAMRVDRRAHIERDIAHRCGVWLQIASTGIFVLSVTMAFYLIIFGGYYDRLG
jgi:hypothetical protein